MRCAVRLSRGSVTRATISLPVAARAQDPFEIEVYGYQTAERGEWELGGHLNYIGRGTTAYDRLIAPTEHQAHLALELTRGLTDHWEVAAYLLSVPWDYPLFHVTHEVQTSWIFNRIVGFMSNTMPAFSTVSPKGGAEPPRGNVPSPPE